MGCPGRPCVVYSVEEEVLVRTPQLHKAINIFTPQAVSAAVNDAVGECARAGGTECAVLAVGPFVVAPK